MSKIIIATEEIEVSELQGREMKIFQQAYLKGAKQAEERTQSIITVLVFAVVLLTLLLISKSYGV